MRFASTTKALAKRVGTTEPPGALASIATADMRFIMLSNGYVQAACLKAGSQAQMGYDQCMRCSRMRPEMLG